MRSIDNQVGGGSFDTVFNAFLDRMPIRNVNWAPGVCIRLNVQKTAVTMIYADSNSTSRDHDNVMDYLSVRSLAEPAWIVCNPNDLEERCQKL